MESIKREDLLAKGYTEEQVTDILNTVHGLNNENKKLQTELNTKSELETKVKSLQSQLEEINKANMTEQERLASEKAETEKYLSNAKRIYNTAKAKEILAGINVNEKLIEKLVSDDENETIQMATLYKEQIINERENSAKQTKENITNLNVKPTPTNIPQGDDKMTVDKFNKMTMTEQVLWKRENAQEYDELFNN